MAGDTQRPGGRDPKGPDFDDPAPGDPDPYASDPYVSGHGDPAPYDPAPGDPAPEESRSEDRHPDSPSPASPTPVPPTPSSLDGLDWDSFFDIATTTQAAEAMDALYGAGAARACIACALAARLDGRAADCRFWTAVLRALRGYGRPN